MEIGKSFSFVFEDEKWVSKVIIGAIFYLLSVFIIGAFFVFGYMMELIRNVANGNPNPLPEWDNLGSKLGRGFMLFLVFLVYSLPLIVLYICAFIPSIAASNTDNTGVAGVAGLISAIGFCLVFIYAIILAVLSPAIIVRYAITGSFGSCFQFGQLISFITSNLGNYVIAILIAIVANLIGQLGIIACGIGVFLTSFYAMLVISHIFGQVYRQAVQRGTGFQTI